MELSREQQRELAVGVVIMTGWTDEEPEMIRQHITEEYGRTLPLEVIREAQQRARVEKEEAAWN